MTNTTTTITAPQRPAPMDNTRINTPGEYRAWQDAEASYFATLRRIEQVKQQAAEQAKAEANKTLTENEYYLEACERHRQQQEKAAAAQAAEKAAARAEVDRLSASPDVVDIMQRNEWAFIQEVCHWSRRQYTLEDGGLHACMPGLYHATMTAPAKKGGK